MSLWNRDLLPSRWNDRAVAPLNDVDDLFNRFRKEFFSPDFFRNGDENFMPKVEVKETDKNINVSAEIPGMSEKDISVTLQDNNLIIEGEKKSERKKEDKGYYSSEFSYGSFYRTIPLRTEVDAEKVNATYKDGVLNVTLNKLKEGHQNSKRIEIKH